MRLGLGLSVCTPTRAFDPSMLPMTALWRDYAGAPWTSLASAGSSGGRTLTDAAPPTTGALNGHGTADFGTTKKLATASPSLVSSYLSAAAWSIYALVNPTAALTGTIIYDNTGYWDLGFSSGAAAVEVFNGSTYTKVSSAALSVGAWALVQARYDGTNLSIRANGGSWVSTACVQIMDLATPLTMPTISASARVAELGISNISLSNSQFDSLLAYARARYGLAL